MAQNPFKNLTKNEAVRTFKVPDIVDFVTVFLSETEDELRGSIAPEWQKYLKNEKLSKGVTITVDKKNGYVRYEMDEDVANPKNKTGYKSYVEYCYWNCSDGLHKLFACRPCNLLEFAAIGTAPTAHINSSPKTVASPKTEKPFSLSFLACTSMLTTTPHRNSL